MQFRHPLMRQADRIEIVRYDGQDRMTIAGPGAGAEGIWLAPHSTGLFDSPFKTNWSPGMFGAVYQSWVPKRRDVVFTVHVLNPITGTTLDHDPHLWHTIYSRFKAMWSIEQESTIIYTSDDGERTLNARLLQEAKSFQAQNFEGIDPHVLLYGSVMMTVACEFPFYDGGTVTFAWEDPYLTGGNSTWFTLPYYNPSSVMIWPWWYATDQVQWQLPDYSFGWEEYGRGQSDLGKTVLFTPFIEGEICDLYSRPDMEPIIAANGNPVLNRMNGRALEYPIQPGMGSTGDGCVIRAINCTNPNGARLELNLDRWYNEPFSTPLIAAP
jgi:hypothetical protein